MVRQKITTGDFFDRLKRFDRMALIIELALIIAMIFVAGQYAAPLLRGFYAFLFWIGTVVLGILIPFGLYWYSGRLRIDESSLVTLTAVLVLFGGALLRISIVQAGQM
jgi:formate-dependent nitrite reductase membrane component NrfD